MSLEQIIILVLVLVIVLGGIFVCWFISRRNVPVSTKKQADWNYYEPGEQEIYHYWDGEKKRSIDPAKIYKRYKEREGEFRHHIILARSVAKDNWKGQDALIKEICKLFDVKEYEEGKGGLTEAKIMALFDHFFNYNEDVKKNSSSSQTPQMDRSLDSSSSFKENPPISKPTDCGFSENESKPEKPKSSPSEPELPTDSLIPD